jgi:hypothetical protein
MPIRTTADQSAAVKEWAMGIDTRTDDIVNVIKVGKATASKDVPSPTM